MEFSPLDLNDFGEIKEPKNDKVLLVDADTIAYNAALQGTKTEILLPREFYSDAEWDKIKDYISPDESSYRWFDMESAIEYFKDKIARMLDQTGCKDVELHFTIGRNSFRYLIFPDYKANRKDLDMPLGIFEVKEEMAKNYFSIMNTKWEADDAVIYNYKNNRDKYILAAIDKDVLNTVSGRHFRYYEKPAYTNKAGLSVEAVNMGFIDVTEEEARIWPFIQTILGDVSDNIPKVAGIGIAKIKNYIKQDMSNKELWAAVVNLWGDETKALEIMRLVNMHQLTEEGIKLIDIEEIIK